jgi:hypothetical protein
MPKPTTYLLTSKPDPPEASRKSDRATVLLYHMLWLKATRHRTGTLH